MDSSNDRAIIKNMTTGDEVTCIYRPKEYAFAKTNAWTPGKAAGASMQPPRFNGGQPMTLELDLLFDTYELKQDVRNTTGTLWKMMKVTEQHKDGHTNRSEPPIVEFRWGSFWSFKAVITSISEKFTLFLAQGTPVRSMLHLSLLQAQEEGRYPGQNPTSGGRDGYAVHTVREGETIDWIAFKEYGSSNMWRHLASANSLDDPDRLRGGQHLLIVPYSD